MSKLTKSTLCGCLLIAVAFFCVMALGNTHADAVPNCAVESMAVTKCWMATCGHKTNTYTWPGYSVSSRGTDYHYTGVYADPGVQTTVTYSYSYTNTISAGLEFGNDYAKASLGMSGSMSKTWSISQTVTNNTSTRKYVHMGIEYANRNNKITNKHRTYDPGWDLFGWNNYCKFEYRYCYPKGRTATGCGLSLRSGITY